MKEKGREVGRNKEAIKADLDLMQSGGPRDAQQPTLSGAQNQKAQLLQRILLLLTLAITDLKTSSTLLTPLSG